MANFTYSVNNTSSEINKNVQDVTVGDTITYTITIEGTNWTGGGAANCDTTFTGTNPRIYTLTPLGIGASHFYVTNYDGSSKVTTFNGFASGEEN